ncbi:hypothetical protein [Demequina sp. NBRC 110057]|uniref:hypothetical protein n=1 Tax=Demequina sp. NBRC 110057 TaxID=1570346 RepID=UPI000A04D780|nr:hypothetical protein [Demequina sp. NBRC 110057]
MGDSTTRRGVRAGVWITAVVVAGIGLAAALVALLLEQTYVLSFAADSDTLIVSHAPAGSCDSVVWERVTETATTVSIDIRSIGPIPGIPRNAMQEECVATFNLDAPLGDREVVTANTLP